MLVIPVLPGMSVTTHTSRGRSASIDDVPSSPERGSEENSWPKSTAKKGEKDRHDHSSEQDMGEKDRHEGEKRTGMAL
jgi:hypothetical protein